MDNTFYSIYSKSRAFLKEAATVYDIDLSDYIEVNITVSAIDVPSDLLKKLNIFYKNNKEHILNKICLITSSQIKRINQYMPIIEEWAISNNIKKVIYITQLNSDLHYPSSIVKIRYLNSITYTILERSLKHYKDEYIQTEINNHYNYLTYSIKPHRSYMYALLKKYKLLEYGVTSYNQHKDVSNFIPLAYLLGITVQEYNSYINDKIFADLSDNLSNKYHLSSYKDFLLNIASSAISIVAESTYSNTYTFITEKTYINFMLKKPFLLIGDRHSLKFLQEYYGFKTFSSIWDESYDNEPDIVVRVAAIFKITYDLCKLPLRELKDKIKQIEDITEYNYQLYCNLPHKKFIKEVLLI
jgi:hypothetical protein